MRKLLIEPHYLGSLEYYTALLQYDEVIMATYHRYTKQTFKNRCYFLSANGTQPLSIPVKFSNRSIFKEVRIDHQQNWMRTHWGACYSAYGKAPFFEYFAEGFRKIWEKQHDFLIDLNYEMMTLCLKCLQSDIQVKHEEAADQNNEKGIVDLREHILPKIAFAERTIYHSYPYNQIFGSNFVPNLSIVDLLMSEGPRAAEILLKSAHSENEQL